MTDGRLKRRLAAIMMADVVGFSRLMAANEEGTLVALHSHRREFFDPTVSRHGGRIFKTLGDGFFVEFASAFDAAQCAVEIQRGMVSRNLEVPDDRHIKFRIGINLADAIVEGDDFHGDDVNTAAKLMSLAPPGGIACSAGIRHQIGTKMPVRFVDQGERILKHIMHPIHVFLIDFADVLHPDAILPRAGEAIRIRSPKPSVAVLPFVNMSGDLEQEYFSDGITEDIITDLSKVSELFVLSRNAVFLHKGKAGSTDQLASDLGVAYLVHGSVRKAGSKVRITAQLTEGASGGQMWADRYDRDLTDIFAVQDEITKTIVEQLQVKLLPRERTAIEAAPTSNVEAYTYYLMGREHFHHGSKANYLRAKRMFAKAIELDPAYARAYAGLADCDAFLYMDYSENVAADVLANSEAALSLQENLVEARASRALGLSIVHRYEESDREFEDIIATNPNNFEARFFYGRSCYAQGKLELTAQHWERAAEIKPDDYQALILLHQVYTSLDQPDAALRAARRGVERAESEHARNPENPRPAYLTATTLAKLGEGARAEEWAKLALAIAPDDYLTLYNIACFYSAVGRIDQAFGLLERLLPISNDEMKDWMLKDSDLDPLHDDPRWQMVRLGATLN